MGGGGFKRFAADGCELNGESDAVVFKEAEEFVHISHVPPPPTCVPVKYRTSSAPDPSGGAEKSKRRPVPFISSTKSADCHRAPSE